MTVTKEEIDREKAMFAKMFGANVELREDQAINRIRSRRYINARNRR